MNNFLTIWNSAPFRYIVFTICVLIIAFYLKKWIGDNLSESTKRKGLGVADRALNRVVKDFA